MKTVHALKTWPPYFEQILSGAKPFEIRLADREYAVGDLLDLQEWKPELEDYTGRNILVEVTYITDFGQKPGFIVMGIKPALNLVLKTKDHPEANGRQALSGERGYTFSLPLEDGRTLYVLTGSQGFSGLSDVILSMLADMPINSEESP